ncbi:MAG: hypothetical protein HOW73_25005 [Polyangiaceae bacterium]|nr:hypothetical protein [Polyangiaceae bacterium]
MRSLLAAFVCIGLAACTSEESPPQGEGGGGSEPVGGSDTGGGGAAAYELRPMSVQLVQAIYQGTLPEIDVFASAPDGTLLSQAVSDANGVAELMVTDGGYVTSAVRTVFTAGDTDPAYFLRTIRVVPGMTDATLGPLQQDATPNEPMHLHLEWDPVPDADGYMVWTSCSYDESNYGAATAPSTTLDLDIVGCPNASSFGVVVTALAFNGDVSVALAQAARTSLPFEVGSDRTETLALTPITSDPIEVTLSNLEDPSGIVYSLGFQRAAGLIAILPNEEPSVATGEGAVTLALPIPSLDGMVRTASVTVELDDCSRVGFAETREASFSTELDPLRLALPHSSVAGGATTWTLDEGDLGDAVVISRNWLVGDIPVLWEAFEIAATEGQGPPALELPPELAADFTMPAEVATLATHMDVSEATDYATFLDLVNAETSHRFEQRTEPNCADTAQP